MENRIKPVFVTGADRSGSGLVMRVFTMCGANTGHVNRMFENKKLKKLNSAFINRNTNSYNMPSTNEIFLSPYMQEKIIKIILEERLEKGIFVYKDSGLSQVWKIWNELFPEAKWIIVRRRTGDILNSCIQTAYMKRFKNERNLDAVNAMTEREGWSWWVKQYEAKFIEMIKADLDYRIVWPERMRDGNYLQMKETVEWIGLKWNKNVRSEMSKLLR